MAFGDLLGVLVGSGTDMGATNILSGSVAVSVGDLVVVSFAQVAGLTSSGVTDNLGNTYTAQNAGSDPGNATGHAFHSRVANAGTLTTVTVAGTPSANDWSTQACCYEGPFADPAIDANPANITNDATSPFTCPATGTLAQADELVVCWGAANIGTSGSNTWAATSPNLLADNESTAAILSVQGYQVVAATTSVTPEFTAAVNPSGQVVLGTMSFMKAAAAGGNIVGKGLLDSMLLRQRRLAA